MPVVTIHPEQEHPGTNTAIIFNGSDFDSIRLLWDKTEFSTVQDLILNTITGIGKLQEALSEYEEEEVSKVKFTDNQLRTVKNSAKNIDAPDLVNHICNCIDFFDANR